MQITNFSGNPQTREFIITFDNGMSATFVPHLFQGNNHGLETMTVYENGTPIFIFNANLGLLKPNNNTIVHNGPAYDIDFFTKLLRMVITYVEEVLRSQLGVEYIVYSQTITQKSELINKLRNAQKIE